MPKIVYLVPRSIQVLFLQMQTIGHKNELNMWLRNCKSISITRKHTPKPSVSSVTYILKTVKNKRYDEAF